QPIRVIALLPSAARARLCSADRRECAASRRGAFAAASPMPSPKARCGQQTGQPCMSFRPGATTVSFIKRATIKGSTPMVRTATGSAGARTRFLRKELTPHGASREAAMALTLVSSAFTPNGEIPRKHTCEREDPSPPLAWQGQPGKTKTFALIVDDPDAPDPKAPKMTWVHWVVYNLPAATRELAADASRKLPAGARDGKNDW